MERAQAEIDELQEQVNKAAEKEKAMAAQLKSSSSASGGAGDAALAARAKEAEKEVGKLRDEIVKLKDMMGGYLDMIEDLKDELDEAKNGPGAKTDPAELEALRDAAEEAKVVSEKTVTSLLLCSLISFVRPMLIGCARQKLCCWLKWRSWRAKSKSRRASWTR